MSDEGEGLFRFASNTPKNPETIQYTFDPDYGEQSELTEFSES